MQQQESSAYVHLIDAQETHHLEAFISSPWTAQHCIEDCSSDIDSGESYMPNTELGPTSNKSWNHARKL